MNLIEFARFIKNNIFLINSNMKEFPNSNESIVWNNCIVAKSIQQKLELIRKGMFLSVLYDSTFRDSLVWPQTAFN